jgi:putative NADH-flavin reductase
MKPIRLLIAAVILAGLGGAVWWSNKIEAAKEAKPPVDTTPQIMAVNEAGIQGIEIHQREANVTTVLKREGQTKWVITAPKPLATDQMAIATILIAAANLRGDRILDESGTGLANYGLDPPAVAVSFIGQDGKTTKLLIGEATPTNSDVYAMVEGDKRVYTMTASHKTEFDKTSKDLREKHLMIADADKASSIEVASKSQTIAFARSGDNWQILKPKAYRADGTTVEEVLRKVRDATLDADALEKDGAKFASAFAAGQPVATVRINDLAGAKTLEIRKNKDDCYAKSSMLEGVYKANKDLCDGMDKPLDQYRNKKLFDFGFSDPSRIEFKEGAKTSVYEKSGDGWKSSGKAMDSVAIQNLIDKLRDASAAKLSDTGYTTPSIEIAVTAGKFNERVQISSNNGKFFGHREGDPTVYEIDASTIDDLRNSANGIQPSPDKKQDKK